MSGRGRTEPDVFFSYRSVDRAEARPLWEALERQGLAVFVDECAIDVHDSITEVIEEALPGAKAFVAYYSRAFLQSRYCLMELIESVIRAQGADQVRQRIFAVNPEADGDHIEPIELRDARWAVVPGQRRERTEFAAEIARAVRGLDGTLGDLGRGAANDQWWPHPPVAPALFVGQHEPLLQLYSALNAGRYRFAEHRPRAGTAVVHGFGGIGKTALVEQYATDFGAAYPGGIVSLSAHGGELDDQDDPNDRGDDPRRWSAVLADYRTEVRRYAAEAGIPVHDAPADELLDAVARHLTSRGERCLWVIDAVPAGIPAAELRELLVPSRFVHTVVTTRDARHAELGEGLPMDGLSVEDALVLLAGAYPRAEEDEVRGLIGDVGGHPLALVLAGAELRQGLGVLPVAQQRERTRAGAAGYIGDAVRRLDETSMAVLGVADALAAAPIPIDLLLRALATAGAAWAGETVRDRAAEAVAVLAERGIVRRADAGVIVHRLVAQAYPRSDRAERRVAAATALAELLDRPMAHATQAPLLVHARHFATGEEGPPDAVATTLLQWLAGADRREGEHRSAGELGEVIVERLTRGGAALDEHAIRAAVTAAEEYTAVVDARAEGLAWRAVEAPGLRGGADTASARRALARALDGRGRFDDAEPHWRVALTGRDGLDRPSAAGLTVDRIRALRLRGRLDEAEALLADLDATGLPGPPSLVAAARHLEEANLHLLRGRPGRARRAAERAVDSYRSAGLERDPAYLEALSVLVDAQLAAYVRWPYIPARRHERKFLDQARALGDDFADRYGPSSPLTLIARISYGVHLVRWDAPREGYALLTDAELEARSLLGRRHPHRLRALHGLSIGAMQTKRLPEALELAEQAYEGQREVLGPHHPDTLLSQLQNGIARKLVHSDDIAARLVRDASAQLTKALGLGHDEVWRSWVCRAFLPVPAPALRRFLGLFSKDP